ncbi:hypothetical protein BGW42_003940 [Actinomortierella wolfii]|nr:hypothetical protein BGW42_003940 [Actinomortierella wolfii]
MASLERSLTDSTVDIKFKVTKPPKPEIVIVLPQQRKGVGMGTFATESEENQTSSDRPTLCDITATTTTSATTIALANTQNHEDNSCSGTPTGPSTEGEVEEEEASLNTPPSKGGCAFSFLPASLITTPAQISKSPRDLPSLIPLTPLTPATPATTLASASTSTPTPSAHSAHYNSYFPATPASVATSCTTLSSKSSTSSNATFSDDVQPVVLPKEVEEEIEEKKKIQPECESDKYKDSHEQHQKKHSKGSKGSSHHPEPPPPLTIPTAAMSTSPRPLPPPPRRRPPYSRAPSSSSLSTPSSRGPPTAETLQSMSEWRRIQYEAAAAGPPPPPIPPQQDDLLPCHHPSSVNHGFSPISLKMQPHRPAATLLAPITTNFHSGNNPVVLSSTTASTVSPPVSAFPRSNHYNIFSMSGTNTSGGEDGSGAAGLGREDGKAGEACNCCGCSNDSTQQTVTSPGSGGTTTTTSCQCAAVETPSSVMTFGPEWHALANGGGSEASAPFKYLQPQGTRSFPHHLQTQLQQYQQQQQQAHPLTVYTSNLNHSTPTLGCSGGAGHVNGDKPAIAKLFMPHNEAATAAAAAAGGTATLGSENFGTTASTNSEVDGPQELGSPAGGFTATTNMANTERSYHHPYHSHSSCHRHHHHHQQRHHLESVPNPALSRNNSSNASSSDNSLSRSPSLSHSVSTPNLRLTCQNNLVQTRKYSVCQCVGSTAATSDESKITTRKNESYPTSDASAAGSVHHPREFTSSMASLSALIGEGKHGNSTSTSRSNSNSSNSSRSSSSSSYIMRSISKKFKRSGSRRRLRVATSFVAPKEAPFNFITGAEDSVAKCHGDEDGEMSLATAAKPEGECMSPEESDGNRQSFPMLCQPLSAIRDSGRNPNHGIHGSNDHKSHCSLRRNGGEAGSRFSMCGCTCHGSSRCSRGESNQHVVRSQSVKSGDVTSEYMTATATTTTASTTTASQGRASKERKSGNRLYLSGLRKKHKQNKLLQKANKYGLANAVSAGTATASYNSGKSSKKKSKGSSGQNDWVSRMNSSPVRQEFAQYNYERQIQDFQRAARIFREQKAITAAAAAAALMAETRAAVAEAQAATAKAAAAKKSRKIDPTSGAGAGSPLRYSVSMANLELRGLPSPIQETMEESESTAASPSAVPSSEKKAEKSETTNGQNETSDLKRPASLNLDAIIARNKKSASIVSSSSLFSKLQGYSRSRPETGSVRSSVYGLSCTADEKGSQETGQVSKEVNSDLRLPRLQLSNGFRFGSMDMDRFLTGNSADGDSSAQQQQKSNTTVASSATAPFENIPLGEATTGSGTEGVYDQRLGIGNSLQQTPFRPADDSILRRASNISRDGFRLACQTPRSGTIGSSFMTPRTTNSICSISSISQQIAAKHSLRLHRPSSAAMSLQSQSAAALGLNSGYLGGDLPPPSPAFATNSTACHSPVTPTFSTCFSTSEPLENSPIQVVRATVGTVDDPSLPCFTFRMWVLSTVFVALGAVSSEYNFFRANSAYFSIYFVQLASYFCGKAMARWLPTRKFTIRLDFRPVVRAWESLRKSKKDGGEGDAEEPDAAPSASGRPVSSTRGSMVVSINSGNGSHGFGSTDNSGASCMTTGSGRSFRAKGGWSAQPSPKLSPHLSVTASPSLLAEPIPQSPLPSRSSAAFPGISFQDHYSIGRQSYHSPVDMNRSTPERTSTSKPTKGLFKWTFTLNNGKFNMKEHMLIGVTAAAGSVPAYATNVLAIQDLVFDAPLSKLTGIGLVVSSQCIGYSLAWCLFDFVIKPSVMVWPSTLVNVSLYNTLHEHKVLTRWFTRMQLFWYAFFAVFVYQWLPRFFAPVLTSMALLCWINPNSNVLRKLGSGYTGLGIGCISLDWSIISGWAQANFFVGLIVMLWIITPIVYFSDYWSALSYPIVSSNLYDSNAELYDITKILNADLTFNETMYENYSPVIMTPYFAITYGTCFMAVMATFTHVLLFYGADIWCITKVRTHQWKDRMAHRWRTRFGRNDSKTQGSSNGPDEASMDGGMFYSTTGSRSQYPCFASPETPCGEASHRNCTSEHRAQIPTAMFGTEDIHTRLMMAYKDIPGFWFAILFAICFAMAVLICNDPEIQLPFYALILGFLLAALFALPMAIIQALSSSQVGLNVLSEVVCGWLLPGNQLGNSVFKCYSYMALFQCLNLTQSFKLGHYMKVGPRKIFIMVLYGTLLGAILNVQVLEWVLTIHREDLFTGDPHSGWSLRNLDLFFSASLLWGAISPKRLFAAESLYHFLPYCFIIGLFLPVPFYIMFRLFPPASMAASMTSSTEATKAAAGASTEDGDPSETSLRRDEKWWQRWRLRWVNKLTPMDRQNSNDGTETAVVDGDEEKGGVQSHQDQHQKQHHRHHHHQRRTSKFEYIEECDHDNGHIGSDDDKDLEAGYHAAEACREPHDPSAKAPPSSSGLERIPSSSSSWNSKCSSACRTKRRSRFCSFGSKMSPSGFARAVPWHLINTPLICVGASFVPQAPASFVVSAGIVAFVFAFLVLRYRHEWWRRYTFVLAAALDAGTQICNMAIFVVFSLILSDRVEFVQWAGNHKSNPERCGVGDGYN